MQGGDLFFLKANANAIEYVKYTYIRMIDIMDRATHIMRQETTPQLTVKQCNIYTYIHTYIYIYTIYHTKILCHVYVLYLRETVCATLKVCND